MTALGWTLLNFIWQGALIAVVLAVALRAIPAGNPRGRYAACCIGLLAMMLAPPITLAVVLWLAGGPTPSPAAVAATAFAPTATRAWLAPVLPQLATCWIAGVLLLQTRLLVQWLAAQRMRRRGVVPARAPWPATVAELCARLGIRRTVAIVESAVAQVPMVIGWLRPVILVPAGLMTGLTQQQLLAIIAHELAHVRRHDYLVNLVQAVLETLLFYHPAVWWLSNRLRVEREYCCDDVAVGIGGDAIRYARTLSLLETIRSETLQPALASTGGTLMTRIQRLLGVQPGTPARSGGWMAPAAITIAVVTACSGLALARPVEPGVHPAHDDAGVVEFIGEPADVDVVGVLREVGSPDAVFFETLRDAGVDNRTMMMILERLGPDDQVRDAIRGAAKRSLHVELRLMELNEHLRDAVAAGRLSKEEATEKFHVVLDEIKDDLRPGLLDEAHREMDAVRARLNKLVAEGLITKAEADDQLREAHEALKDRLLGRRAAEMAIRADVERKLQAIQAQAEADVAAGLITEAEARQRMDDARRELHETLQAADVAFPGVAAQMQQLHDEIRAALEAGEITREEAERRMHDAATRLHGHMSALQGRQRQPMPEAMRDRLREIHEEIKAAIEAGEITMAEAEEHLRAAERALHEQFRTEIQRRQER